MKENAVPRALLCLLASAASLTAPAPLHAADWTGGTTTVRKPRVALRELADRLHRAHRARVAMASPDPNSEVDPPVLPLARLPA